MDRVESHRVKALLAELDTSDDAQTFLVLADALIERGDPRGELIGLQAQGKVHDVRASALIETHIEALTGLGKGHGVTLEWRNGFVHRADVPCPAKPAAHLPAEWLRTLLTHAGARRLRELVLRGPAQDTDGVFNGLFKALDGVVAGPELQTLQLGDGLRENAGYWVYGYYGESRLSDDLALLWQRFANVGALRLDLGASYLQLGKIEAPTLRRFDWVAPFLHPDYLGQLCTARWPALQHFVLWTGREIYVNTEDELYGGEDEDYGGGADTSDQTIDSPSPLEPLFTHLDTLEHLTSFGIGNYAGDWSALAKACSAHPFWQRLTSIDLTRGELADAQVDGLLRALRRAPKLQRVVGEALTVSADGWKALCDGLPGAEVAGAPVSGSSFHYVITQE